MALCVWNWRNAWPYRDPLSPLDSGKSALVDDSRTKSRGGTNRCRSGRKVRTHEDFAGHRQLQAHAADTDSHAHVYAVARDLGRDRARISSAFTSWFCIDADAGLLLQRHLFHLRVGPDAVLQRARAKCGQLSLAVCAGERARPAGARAFVRHNRTQKNDHGYLWSRRDFARAHRLVFSRGHSPRGNESFSLDNNLLHRVRSGELGILDCERNFPVGDPRPGDSDFLRDWNAGGGGGLPFSFLLGYGHPG